MILFQTATFQQDLSAFSVSLKEENNLFTDNSSSSYSIPFLIDADAELLSKLGIPTLDNVRDYETRIAGKLVLDNTYYQAFLYLGEIVGKKIECTITYGNEVMEVYSQDLKTLPWPLIIQTDLINFAENIKDQEWPQTGFNFPMVYRPKIRESSNYEAFEGFVNNHTGGDNRYKTNFIDSSGAEPVYNNINVLAPFPYLLEILNFGYAQEGKQLIGELVKDPVFKKALYIPEDFLERFRGSEYQNFNYDKPTTTISEGAVTYGIYRFTLIPQEVKTYELTYNLNLDPILARYFEFKVIRESIVTGEKTELLRKFSQNNRVRLSDKLKINTEESQQFDPVYVELKLIYTAESLSQFTSFEYRGNGGQLNEFPSSFSLADFMPDMNFGEYENHLKNWLNLDITVGEKNVRVDFAQNSIFKKPRVDHRHLEIPKPTKSANTNRFYILEYKNGDQVFVNKTGQVFSNLDDKGLEQVKIEMEAWPAVVESNEDIITAVYPEDAKGLVFCIYDGIDNDGKPTCSTTLANALSLDEVLDKYWLKWLNYRVNSKSFKESFKCYVYEQLNISEISFKYNELHILKKLSKKYLSENLMQVEIESETF